MADNLAPRNPRTAYQVWLESGATCPFADWEPTAEERAELERAYPPPPSENCTPDKA